MALCTAGSTLPLSSTLSVYPMPLCFGTMETNDKGNTWQSNLLRQFRIARQEGAGRRKEGQRRREDEEERRGERKKGRGGKTGHEEREEGRGWAGMGRVETRINRGRERRRRKEEKAEKGERREEDIQGIP